MRFALMMAFVPVLMIAACHTAPSPPPQPLALPRDIGPVQGLDLATDASPMVNEIKERRIGFVARYYRDPNSRWPALSAYEARQLSSQGLKIVAVWESHARNPRNFSYFSGYNDAMTASMQAKAIGQPPGSAIYFAVDFDARSYTMPSIYDYFRGVSAGLAAASGGRPDYTVGVYGSGAVCDWIKRTGLAMYSWLSNSIAWAGSLDYADWNIRQGGRLFDLPFNHDSDEAQNEYGAFRLGDPAVAGSSAANSSQYLMALPGAGSGQSPNSLVSALP